MKNIANITDINISDEMIDSRIVESLREYIKSIEGDIKGEITKAGYILGFQGTILFIASAKIGLIESIYPKIIIMCIFIISSLLSFYVIAGKSKLFHINIINKIEFNRVIALGELKIIYQNLQKIFIKKVLLNNINMFIQIIMLTGILLLLLF